MDSAVANRYVAGPEVPIVPGGRILTGWVVSLDSVEAIFWFVNTIAVNTVTTGIQFLACFVLVISIWEDIETIYYDAAGQVKTNVV